MNPPPNGAIIKIAHDFDGHRITIPSPKRKLGDAGGFLFLCFWICAWAFFEIMVARALWNAISESKFDGGFWFILFWFGGWTVGGVFAIIAARRLALGEPPEVVLIGHTQIAHERNRIKKTFSRESVSKVHLETSGGNHFLYVDVGADRIYIGEHISEPVREWLYDTIKEWKGA
jgi:hypothetical protein